MSKPAVRTSNMVRDDVNRIKNLFGTIMNAYRLLGFSQAELTYAQFYRAMHFETITPAQKAMVEEAWARWQFLFLRDQIPPSSDLTITMENRDIVPTWHPECDEDPDEEEEEAPTSRRLTIRR